MGNINYLKKMLIAMMVLFITNTSFSRGIESGGGGSTVAVPTIGLYELDKIIQSSRAELILFFNSQTAQVGNAQSLNNTLEFKKLLSATQSIFDVIKNTPIYPYLSCKDQNNIEVDGSIISPKVNTICISENRLVNKLSFGTARGQVLALIAHEYSHLLGLNEDEATRLQENILRVIEEDSKDKLKFALDTLSFNFGALRGAFINDGLYNNQQKNWNYRCQFTEKIAKYIENIRELKNFKQFAFFNKEDGQRFNSYMLKSRALSHVSCGNSDYDPSRVNLKNSYNSAFGVLNSIPIEQWNNTISIVSFDIDKSVSLKKVITEVDFNEELKDLKNYTEIEYKNINDLERIYRNGYIRF